MTVAVPLLVIHDRGDLAGGAPWAQAFGEAGWQGSVLAPDLPGHAGTAPPLGGNYEFGDAVFALLPVLRDLASASPPVIVGVGSSGWPAMVMALGGRASALVLVDGLGGPWATPAELVGLRRDHLRAVAGDPEALAMPPAGVDDPRLRHPLAGLRTERLATRVAAAMPVPTLVVESPLAALTGAGRDRLLEAFTSPVRLVSVAERTPEAVAPAVGDWLLELD